MSSISPISRPARRDDVHVQRRDDGSHVVRHMVSQQARGSKKMVLGFASFWGSHPFGSHPLAAFWVRILLGELPPRWRDRYATGTRRVRDGATGTRRAVLRSPAAFHLLPMNRHILPDTPLDTTLLLPYYCWDLVDTRPRDRIGTTPLSIEAMDVSVTPPILLSFRGGVLWWFRTVGWFRSFPSWLRCCPRLHLAVGTRSTHHVDTLVVGTVTRLSCTMHPVLVPVVTPVPMATARHTRAPFPHSTCLVIIMIPY